MFYSCKVPTIPFVLAQSRVRVFMFLEAAETVTLQNLHPVRGSNFPTPVEVGPNIDYL